MTGPEQRLKAGELAKATGVSKDTLRFYEKSGLLHPDRASNGYRLYPASAVERIELVRSALAVGFRIRELSEILKTRDAGGAPCADVRRLAGEKLATLEETIADLSVLRDDLRAILKDWDRTLARTQPGRRAGLLQELARRRTAGKEKRRKTMIRMNGFRALALAAALLAGTAVRAADMPADCPMHANHAASNADPATCPYHAEHMKTGAQNAEAKDEHFRQVETRGDRAMGFRHDRTTHHFRLTATGGAIEVDADREDDASSREAIREHLAKISAMFASGDFSLPAETHGVTPPGVATMKRHRQQIAYAYESTPRGGRVRMTTADEDSLAAIHDFLRFQIMDHRTGDSTDEPETDAGH